ncbi:hypothetical protein BDV95DRAFT_638322 [Massariosphaeria phaeospora]|uniref:FAD-binding domain-containing protein n=1 Tax=Massariosphaeria phaeospora TaxID=100035 RepID=A0A7C8MML1_9PLEO|nr:hypothetical protein BDV95DRAFT_638322 [Massariosphaeria phaeospora]
MFMHDVLDNGETVQFVVSGVTDEEWGEGEWSKKLDSDALHKAVGDWSDTPIKKSMIEAMLQNPELKTFAQWHHKEDAPTYAKGHVCVMGNTAYCTTPWQGSGAGQAFEDAMILETLLKEVRDATQLTAAFRAYDQARRPRTQRVIQSSQGTGLILCGRGPDIRLDVDKIRAALPQRWGFIHGQDQKKHKADALAALREVV